MLARTHCACTTCTVFWHEQPGQSTNLRKLVMDSLGNAPIVRGPTCLGSHAVLVRVHSYGMDSLSNVPIVPACVSSHVLLVPVPQSA